MRIMDQNEEPTKACLQFSHKGYIVSSSSLMGKFVEVGYWEESGDDTFFRVGNIPEAIYAIDKIVGDTDILLSLEESEKAYNSLENPPTPTEVFSSAAKRYKTKGGKSV